MEIRSTIQNSSGETFDVFFREEGPLTNLAGKNLRGVHAYCFYNGKLLIVHDGKKKSWTPPGGGIEPGESFEDAVVREVKEETNMRVIRQEVIGYQDIYETGGITRQVRSFCIVEPFGDFTTDPDGDITEIKLIDPQDYKEYFDWGEIGDRIMIRALELQFDI